MKKKPPGTEPATTEKAPVYFCERCGVSWIQRRAEVLEVVTCPFGCGAAVVADEQ